MAAPTRHRFNLKGPGDARLTRVELDGVPQMVSSFSVHQSVQGQNEVILVYPYAEVELSLENVGVERRYRARCVIMEYPGIESAEAFGATVPEALRSLAAAYEEHARS